MRFVAAVLLLCATNLQAQQPTPAQVFGSLTVHVVLGDTNQPARLADVTLQSADEPVPAPSFDLKPKPGSAAPLPVRSYKTGLNGTAQIPQVPPGRYYVVVQQPGYLSLSSQFTREEINHPDDEMKKTIETTNPVVAVAAQQGSTVTVRLTRGATVTGTLRFDDGAPVPHESIFFYRHGKDGKWALAGLENVPRTDDQGRYRASGLPAGEYRLQTQITVSPGVINGNSIFGGFVMPGFEYRLTIYSGDGTRAADAKTLKLSDGENSSGNDITIPVARLHSVSGTLIDARNGAVLNSGRVGLYFGDDKEASAYARVGDDSTFHFDMVLEGVYTLKVSGAKLMQRDPIAPAPGAAINAYAPKFKETPLKSYGDLEEPFTIHGDMTGVTLPIPEADPKAKAKAKPKTAEK